MRTASECNGNGRKGGDIQVKQALGIVLGVLCTFIRVIKSIVVGGLHWLTDWY